MKVEAQVKSGRQANIFSALLHPDTVDLRSVEHPSTSVMKTIFLHAGAVRTGSTAFQLTGIQKNEQLKKLGIYYPVDVSEVDALTGKPTDSEFFASGNLGILTSDTRIHDWDISTLASEIIKLVGSENVSAFNNFVLSSEHLFWATRDQLQAWHAALLSSFGPEPVRVVLVVCLRDLFEHAISWWSHLVRRSNYPIDRVLYLLRKYTNFQAAFLINAAQVFSRDDMLCTRYRPSVDLWQLIIKSARVDEVPDRLFWHQAVNRSFSLDALDYLRELFQLLPEGAWSTNEGGENVGSELANGLGDILARVEATGLHPAFFDKETSELIEENFERYFRGQIDWINATFDIEGGPLLLGPWENSSWRLPSGHENAYARNDIERHFTRALLQDLGRFRFRPLQDEALRKQVAQVELVRRSGIFDDDFYKVEFLRLVQTGYVISSDTAIVHFLKFGAAAGANPSPFFDVLWYQKVNPDLDGEDPVLHYISHGAAEGRSPHPRISPDLATKFREAGNLVALLNRARSAMEAGSKAKVWGKLHAVLELFNPSNQTGRHLCQTTSILNSGIFDAMFYEQERRRLGFPEERLESEALLIDFVTRGQDAGADPSPFFDVLWYRRNNPDLHTVDPVLHYIAHGAAEGRSPHQRIPPELAKALCKTGNPVALLNQARSAVQASGGRKVPTELLAALRLFEWHDATEGQLQQAALILNSEVFDARFYELERRRLGFPQKPFEPEDLLIEFVTHGREAGASPSPFFDVLWYKQVNEDLRDVDAVLHYIEFGASEGRSPHPGIPDELAKAFCKSGNLVAMLNQGQIRLEAGEKYKVSPELLTILVRRGYA